MDMPRRASDSDTGKGPGTQSLKLGLRANAAQFALLVAVNALVGGMVGQQQTEAPQVLCRFHMRLGSASKAA